MTEKNEKKTLEERVKSLELIAVMQQQLLVRLYSNMMVDASEQFIINEFTDIRRTAMEIASNDPNTLEEELEEARATISLMTDNFIDYVVGAINYHRGERGTLN